MSTWRNQSDKPMDSGRGRKHPRGSHTTPQPRKSMELIASVSRSSGLEKDGDTLKDYKVQEEYRVFLQNKVDDVLVKHPRLATETDQYASSRINAQENVLILFRKLREGISSSRREGAFAMEVYETSLYLAAVFESKKQITAVIPHLVDSLYLLPSHTPHKNRIVTVLISLLHHLVAGYPSQGTYRQFLDTLSRDLLPKDSVAYKWITGLSKSLRIQDYATFEALSCPSAVSSLFKSLDDLSRDMESLSLANGQNQGLSRQALHTLLQSLRTKARATTWGIIRSAYRELSCNNEDTQLWLKRSLSLQSVLPSCAQDITPEQWLQQHSAVGHTRQKEGVEGRWLIYKVR